MDTRMSNIATPMPPIRAKFTNKLGIPLSGCKVYTYEPNSDIPKTTWLNIDKTVENTNPILLDSAGEADIFLGGLYRIVVKDRFGFVVYDVEKTGTHTEWDASFVVDGDESQHDINNKTTRQIATISELKNYTPRKNDQIVEVVDYDENVQGVFNKYIYRESSNLDDNHGTVISSNVVGGRWLMLPKEQYVPEDFGVVSGDTFVVTNTARLTSFLESGLNLFIPAKKYLISDGFKSIGITKPTRITGASLEHSIIERVSIILGVGSDGSVLHNFRVNVLSNNYAVYISGASYVTVDHLRTYDSYDGITMYNGSVKMKGCVITNCVAERARRVAFTVDIGAEDTVLENNTAIDSRQGFHYEGAVRTKAYNSKAIRCGLNSQTGVGEQDSYAGPLRSYGVHGLVVDGFENIDPAGVNYWQHGGASGGSFDLVFKNMRGLGSLILDVAPEVTQNMHFENIDTFGIYIEGFLQATVGKIVIENCTQNGVELAMITGNNATDVYINNSSLGTVGMVGRNLYINNLSCATNTRNAFGFKNIESSGVLVNHQRATASTAGFLFDLTNTDRIKLESVRLTGLGTGNHISFTNFTDYKKLVDLGDVQADVSFNYSINGVVAGGKDLAESGVQYGKPKVYRSDVLPTTGVFAVGDKIFKNTVGVDKIYGWVCTTGGVGGAVVWHPLKYAV